RRHPGLVGGRLARLEQLPLRRRQLLVGRALLGLDALDRLPRLVFAPLLRAQLLFRAAALERGLFLLPRHTVRGITRRGHLQVVADDGLFLAVELGLERRDRGLGGGNRQVETGRFLEQPHEGRVAGVGALAQLLDLALGRQDAARFVARATLDAMRPMEYFALARDDRAAGLERHRPGLIAR